MKKVLITGANSYIGTSVEAWLNKNPDQYHVTTVDTINNVWKQADFSLYDVVFHVAGVAHVKETKSNRNLYFKINRDLAIEIAAYAKKNQIKQFVFMSSMSVYGDQKFLKTGMITKETPCNPTSSYGKSKLQAEKGLLELEDDSFKVAILRPPMAYGPSAKGNFPRLVKLIKILPIFPAFHSQRSMLFIDNLCEFVRLVIETEGTGLQLPQNSEYSDIFELVTIISHQLNKKTRMIKLLNPLIVFGSLFSNSLRKIFGTLVYEPDNGRYLENNYNVVTFSDSIIRSVEN